MIVRNMKNLLTTSNKKGRANKKDKILTNCVFRLLEGATKEKIRNVISVSKSYFYKSVNKGKQQVCAKNIQATKNKNTCDKNWRHTTKINNRCLTLRRELEY